MAIRPAVATTAAIPASATFIRPNASADIVVETAELAWLVRERKDSTDEAWARTPSASRSIRMDKRPL
ncbi:hypothetical protein GCM10027080_17020 [Pedococcus soli]